jgi:hypothetical protein
MQRIIVLPTIGDSREDGNVYYTGYAIVESDTLQFDEKVFQDGEDGTGMTHDEVLEHLKTLGYRVIASPPIYLHVEYDED